MSQTSIKKLAFYDIRLTSTFTSYPGTRDCWKDLSELSCRSDICSEFFYQLSQICNNIQSLVVVSFKKDISNGLEDLISAQRNLKYLYISQYFNCNNIILIYKSR